MPLQHQRQRQRQRPSILLCLISLVIIAFVNQRTNNAGDNLAKKNGHATGGFARLATEENKQKQVTFDPITNKDLSQCQDKRKESFGISLGDIHSINPYDNFHPQTYGVSGPDVVGWGLDSHTFNNILNIVRPKFMIEVGSWKGSSAIYFAKKMRELHGKDACIQLICVDTWLGTTAAWENKDMEHPFSGNTLYLRNGYPSVYYQFLYNILHEQVDDIVIPLPLPGVMGSIFVKRGGGRPDTIYIDGCHDYLCVLQDLESWFPLIAVNGIMMGDDFNHASVKKAVTEFCTEEHNCRFEPELSSKRTYVVRKTG